MNGNEKSGQLFSHPNERCHTRLIASQKKIKKVYTYIRSNDADNNHE